MTTSNQLWLNFKQETKIECDSYSEFSFSNTSDLLLELVLAGKKTATSSLYDLYAIENVAIPKVGEYSIILDANHKARCIIKNTKVYIRAFNKIDNRHAYKEGEGNR